MRGEQGIQRQRQCKWDLFQGRRSIHNLKGGKADDGDLRADKEGRVS